MGGGCPHRLAMKEFNNCINDYEMSDMPTSGSSFTWCNGQVGSIAIRQRLDCMLQSDGALIRGGCGSTVLHREGSDHAPILCSWELAMVGSPKR